MRRVTRRVGLLKGGAVAAILTIGLAAMLLLADGPSLRSPSAIRDSAAVLPGETKVAIEPSLASADSSQASRTARAPGIPAPSDARGAEGPASGGPASTDPLGSASDRKIIQNASLQVQVKDVGAAFTEAGRIASAAGGFVASSSFSHAGKDRMATITVRVPVSQYAETMAQLRQLGAKVESETSSANDVTEQYSDLGARLRALDATEGQLLQLLGQARNVAEVLQVQDRLNAVRAEIERVKGRMLLLDKLTELATITVQLAPIAAGAGSTETDLGRTVREAWDNSLGFLTAVAGAVLTVAVFSWWIVALGIPAAWVASRWLRARPRAAALPARSTDEGASGPA